MKDNINKKKSRIRIKRLMIYILSFILSYILVVTAIAPKQYTLKEGDIARDDIKATREIVDEKATKEKEEIAIGKVGKQYTLKSDVKTNAENDIKLLFKKLQELVSVQDEDATKEEIKISENKNIDELQKINNIELSDEQCRKLLAIDNKDIDKIQSSIINIIDAAYEKNIEENDEIALSEARKNAEDKVAALGLESDVEKVISFIVTDMINPNFFYDEAKTQEKIKEAQKNVTKVLIKQNQIVVKEGEPVTEEQIAILSELGMLNNENAKSYIYIYFTLAALLIIIMFLQFNYIKVNYIKIFKDSKKIALISTINVLSIILARALGLISPMIMAFACMPILLTLLINYKVSFVVSAFNLIIISAMNGFDAQFLIIGIINVVLGSTLLKKMQQRSELLYTSVYISVVSGIAALTTGILISNDLKDVLIKCAMAFAGGILSGILATGIMPFLESTFNEVTVFKLLELSNPNNPLLKRLIMEAPGTYHHSVMVANIAEVAAEEVGANAVLTRVGAYYHDVGKLQRPYFFAENLMGMENPHDSIQPNLSASIIISHVKDGIELAKKNNIPLAIQDIIAQHHGDSLVKYFYYTMKNSLADGEEIDEKDYRYKGPIPNTKEAGIIMLADSTEAAVRSIKEHTKEKINDMINNIINDKLTSGQLRDCELTLKDIEKIRQCFITSMNGIYHERIEYPKEKK